MENRVIFLTLLNLHVDIPTEIQKSQELAKNIFIETMITQRMLSVNFYLIKFDHDALVYVNSSQLGFITWHSTSVGDNHWFQQGKRQTIIPSLLLAALSFGDLNTANS